MFDPNRLDVRKVLTDALFGPRTPAPNSCRVEGKAVLDCWTDGEEHLAEHVQDLTDIFQSVPPVIIRADGIRAHANAATLATPDFWVIGAEGIFSRHLSRMVAHWNRAMVAHEIGHNLVSKSGTSVVRASEVACHSTRHQREFEADRLGAILLYLNGYDPHDLAGLFETISMQTVDSNRCDSSHPSTAERIRQTKRFADRLGSYSAEPPSHSYSFRLTFEEPKRR